MSKNIDFSTPVRNIINCINLAETKDLNNWLDYINTFGPGNDQQKQEFIYTLNHCAVMIATNGHILYSFEKLGLKYDREQYTRSLETLVKYKNEFNTKILEYFKAE